MLLFMFSWYYIIAVQIAVYFLRFEDKTCPHVASMTFRRKPFRRMRLPVEPDITSNATIRRIFVERHLVEWTSVEISSKIRRNLVEK